MAQQTPYTYIQCPCSDASTLPQQVDGSSQLASDADDDDRTFDPRASRSNYSLYPLEYLLYCEDCHQIRCPRCVNEEIVTYYCPNCLFEVPSSNLKSEGNRCTRSCFQCPICIGPLSVTSLDPTPSSTALLTADNAAVAPTGPYILTCSYCAWSSNEIGIKFEKPNGIYAQLAKLRNGGERKLTAKELKERRKENPDEPPLSAGDLDADLQFANLKAFYTAQLAEANQGTRGLPGLGDLGFASPGSISRIMSLYTGGSLADRKAKARISTMREASGTEEGLKVLDLDESAAIAKLRRARWDDTASAEQNIQQQERVRFADELRPIPYLLRTKRSKRCPICRHIISKPEQKISNTRFRIRLVAGSYIPSISIRPLASAAPATGAMPPSMPRPPRPQDQLLTPLQPAQYLLTFTNPIFERVKVTLATPATTPGRFASKVTVLCPQFEIDANTDMWDDALKEDDSDRRAGKDGERGLRQREAGKIWEKGRNWVSIVVEVVPASLNLNAAALAKPGEEIDRSPLKEDEDMLEIPMFVRVEWEAEGQADVGTAPGKDKEAKEKRELAYWCVLGIGRIIKE